MTPLPSAAAHLTLDPPTTDETLATIFAAQRRAPDQTPAQVQSQREAGAALIAALRPRDPIEAAYATRAAAAHYGSMECFRRAMFPDTPDNAAIRWHGKAVALSRMNTEMVRTLRECQAATSQVQPHPAARPTVPPLPAPAAVVRPAAATPAKQAGRQDPMPSERKSPAPAASAATTQPSAAVPAKPSGRQNPMPSERPLSAQSAATVTTQLAAALAARPVRRQACPPGQSPVAGPRGLDPRDPMSSERPSFTPSACILSTRPAARSLLSAPPPHQGLRAQLLGSTSDIAAMLAAATGQAGTPTGSEPGGRLSGS
jgi:hypothetical protein